MIASALKVNHVGTTLTQSENRKRMAGIAHALAFAGSALDYTDVPSAGKYTYEGY